MDEKDQEILVRYQMLESNYKSLKDQEKLVLEKIEELQRTKNSLEELGNVKKGETVMIPIGSDNFVQGTIEDIDKILVAIGKGLAVKKSRKDAIKLIEERIDALQKTFNEIVTRERGVISKLENMRSDIERIISQQQ